MKPAPSLISVERVRMAKMQQASPMGSLDMATMVNALNAFRIGNLREAARVWEIMTERDGELAGVKLKRESDVAKLSWEVASDDDDKESVRHAEALRYVYQNLRTTEALDQDARGGIRTLITQMARAHSYVYSVQEVRLRVDNPGAKEVTLECSHCPTWWFETRTGKLRFLPTDFAYEGVPMEDGQWLRTVGNGFMRQLSVAFIAKWLPMAAWLLFTQRFGMPGIHGETTAKPGDVEWTNFEEALRAFANDWVTVTGPGAKINLVEVHSSPNTPFQPLVEYVDRLYAKLYRGGDLSTNSREVSVGASLQGSESETILQDDAAWITDVLNDQVDRPIIRYLFGTEPKAWFRLNAPKKLSVDSDMKAAGFLADRGVRIASSEAADRLGFREAEEDEDVLAAASGAISMPTGEDGIEEPMANEADKRLVTASVDAIARKVAADMAPIRSRLAAISDLTEPEARRQALIQFLEEAPVQAHAILTRPSAAEGIADTMATSYVNGLLEARGRR